MKKQIGATTYGKNAKDWTEQQARMYEQQIAEGFASGTTGEWSQLGMPWDAWTAEEVDGGYAVFVEKRPYDWNVETADGGGAWIASHA